jgi:cold shock CspA family protein
MEENMDAELQKKLTVDEQPPAPQREVGTVIFASYVKGYGFIRTERPGADVWFHVSHVNGEELPQAGQRVSYVLSLDHRDRPRATDIRVEK